MASWTRRRLSPVTNEYPLTTLDTVLTETPACAATCLSVTAIDDPPVRGGLPELTIQRCNDFEKRSLQRRSNVGTCADFDPPQITRAHILNKAGRRKVDP